MKKRKALSYLTGVCSAPASPCSLITFGDGGKRRAESYAIRNRGQVFSAKAVYSIMNPDHIESLGPGYVAAKRPPKYNLVADAASFLRSWSEAQTKV